MLFISCEGFLDTTPDNRAEVDTEDKITSLLVSAYPSSTSALLTEMASDNSMDNGSTYAVDYYEQEEAYLWLDMESSDNDSPKALWDGCYVAIAAANQVLQAIDEMGNPESLNPQKGEALMCRAFGHYMLANFFCLAYNPETASKDMALPYSVSPETEVAPNYERGNMEDFYAKIYADIQAGLPLIDDAIFTVPKYHFNKRAALAFASRMALLYNKYDDCIAYSNEVLGNNPVSIMRDWTANKNATIADGFNLYISASDPGNLMLLTTNSIAGRILGWYGLGERYNQGTDIYSKENVGAPALWGTQSGLIMGRISAMDTKNCAVKITEYFEYTDKVNGIGYTHVVFSVWNTNEVLLNRAEAYALKGDFANAVIDINYWLKSMTTGGIQKTQQEIVDFYNNIEYSAVGEALYADNAVRTIKKELHPSGFTVAEGDMENLIQCILHMRRLETLQEGRRWEDIKRYGLEITHNREGQAPDVLTVDDPRRAFQLPFDVISAGLPANPR